jgi:transposase
MDQATTIGAARVLVADRRQLRWEATTLDERLAADHPARLLWAVTGGLDLRAFYAWIKSVDGSAGRPAIDPRVLLCLWLLAYSEGVGSGRELERLCRVHDAYRWIAGGLEASYHTLNDFRVQFQAELDGLFTGVLGKLVHAGVLTVTRVSQDGTRVSAWAGTGSFRGAATLQRHLDAARAHVARLGRDAQDPGLSAKQTAAMHRGAHDRLARAQRALEVELPLAERPKTGRGCNPSRHTAARVSTTDPECRRMKMANGGFQPAYNVQLAVDTASRAIVGVAVTNRGKDSGLCTPMREQVERRTGLRVKEHLTDEGYRRNEDVVEAAARGVAIYRPPPPLPKGCPRASVYEPGPDDPPAIVEWKRRMASPEGRTIYQERSSTVETVNADCKTKRGLGRIMVVGLDKATCWALWSALAYNLTRFAEVLMKT